MAKNYNKYQKYFVFIIIDERTLVRKIISDDFFAHVFVVRFQESAATELIICAMNKIFNHLDTFPADCKYSLMLYGKTTGRIKKYCVYMKPINLS